MQNQSIQKNQINNANEMKFMVENENVIENKKCKKDIFLHEKQAKNDNFEENFDKNAENSEICLYIKVLLNAYKSLPNIISIIDRIIEKRATTLTPASFVYGSNYTNTYSEMNRVIDLSSRKDKLLNLFVIIENLLNSLCDSDRKIAVLKFVQECQTEDIAKEMNTTQRTIYRKSNKILEKLSQFMLEQNWTISFIKSQIGNEPWIEDLIKKNKFSKRGVIKK